MDQFVFGGCVAVVDVGATEVEAGAVVVGVAPVLVVGGWVPAVVAVGVLHGVGVAVEGAVSSGMYTLGAHPKSENKESHATLVVRMHAT